MDPTGENGQGRAVGGMLALLFCVALVNYLDRFALGALLPLLARDLALSDAQVGFLNGGVFSLIAVLAAIPIGGLADRWSHRAVIAIALLLVSVVTALSTFATSFAILATARLMVGLGQSGITPAANAVIVQSVPADRRATAISIYALGLPFGILIGFLVGGYLAGDRGWRFALLLSAAPGLILSAVVARGLPRSDRQVEAKKLRLRMAAACRSYLAQPIFLLLCLGSASFTMVWLSLLGWSSIYYVRNFGQSVGEAGGTLALVFGLSQMAGLFAGGLIGDRMAKRDPGGYARLGAFASLTALPLLGAAFALFSDDASSTSLLLFAAMALGLLQGAPALAAIQNVAAPVDRALTVSLYLAVVNVVGGIGAQLVGLLSGAWEAGLGAADALRSALLLVTLVGCTASAIAFRAAARFTRHSSLPPQKAMRAEP